MNTNRAGRLLAIAALLGSGCASTKIVNNVPGSEWPLSATALDRSAAKLDNQTHEHIAWAKTYRSRILEVRGPRTIANTLAPFNAMMMHLDAAKNECELLANVHPREELRETAHAGEQAVIRYITELKLDGDLYDAIRSVDVARADDATRFLVHKTLREFRRAGVDRDEETRKRITELNERIVAVGQQFTKNISEDVREITLESPADLAGLPEDWIAKHTPGPDGLIHVTTQYPDYIPFMTYAHNADARKALYEASRNRGYPRNIDVLNELIAKRHELATLLGYSHWAAYVTEDKMIESAEHAQAFIDRISELSREAAKRDYGMLLERKKQDDSAATIVEDWEKGYYENLVKTERYAFDPQSVRPYFNFENVRDGLFELTQKMFGVSYRQVHGLNLWHEDVTAWDVYDGPERIGRFYLDLHPRPNKYGHAAQFDYRTGIAEVRLPQAALVCNFPNPDDSPDGVALMEHDEVVTFFHEFGHLLHAIFSGHRRWIGNSGITTEWDFVEAPSQMLEEWCYNLDALRVFARHYQTGEPIPADLVQALRKAREFGKGIQTAHQMFYAAVSLNFYNRDPNALDPTRLMIELQDRYSPFDYVKDTHFHCSFGHLNGYSAIYYTYMWSNVIAKDLLSKFEREGLLNVDTARRYRKTVLEPGGSKKAAQLVEDFLKRPYSFDAFEAWLNRT